ncbi:MAG: PD-(D/E)XK nuclease family protein, partial [Acetobacter sp.]|nr:PD-(D/E)XK nuclease family protein [Acetobacter sp.]
EPKSEELCRQLQLHNIYGKSRYKKYFASFAPKLERLLSSFEKAETFVELCGVCKTVIEEYRNDYNSLLENLKTKDMEQEYNINAQIEEILVDALDKIASYRGDEKCSKAEFAKLLKLLLSFKEVSSVPTYVDAVMVGDATSSYFGQVQNLIVVGGEGLPALSGDNGLVSDDDIEKLSVVRKIEPSIRMINRRNRFKLFNLLCSCERSLTVSFLEINDEGKRVEPPAYIDGLSKIFGAKFIRAASFSQFARVNPQVDLQKLLLSSGNRKLALENGLLGKENFIQEKTQLGVDASKLFYPKGYTKVTQLECYFNCPFKHFIRYGLRAKETEKYEFDPRDIGNVCHKLAESFVNANMSNLRVLTDEEVVCYVDTHLFEAIKAEGLEEKLDITTDKEGVLDYLKRMATLLLNRICQEQRFSEFRPAFTEKNLEGSLDCKYGEMKLIGKIDRIDIAGDYYRIMDYKTGAVAPILKDLYYGDKLQLFLYEEVAGKSLDKTPAGAFYFDARWDYDKEEQKDAILKGIVINDETVLPMFDYRLDGGKSDIIAVSKSSKGYKGASLAKFALSTFENYARKVAASAIDETLDGYIEPKPDQSACEKCMFRSICLFDKDKGFRKKDAVTQEDIANAMGVHHA